MKPWQIALHKEITMLRQDAHITEWKIHKDDQAWKDVLEYDKLESIRLGRTNFSSVSV